MAELISNYGSLIRVNAGLLTYEGFIEGYKIDSSKRIRELTLKCGLVYSQTESDKKQPFDMVDINLQRNSVFEILASESGEESTARKDLCTMMEFSYERNAAVERTHYLDLCNKEGLVVVNPNFVNTKPMHLVLNPLSLRGSKGGGTAVQFFVNYISANQSVIFDDLYTLLRERDSVDNLERIRTGLKAIVIGEECELLPARWSMSNLADSLQASFPAPSYIASGLFIHADINPTSSLEEILDLNNHGLKVDVDLDKCFFLDMATDTVTLFSDLTPALKRVCRRSLRNPE